MPLPIWIWTHLANALTTDLGANIGPNLFHQNRTVSWLTSIPRSCSMSSTFRNESGKRTYNITARRMISGLVLKKAKRIWFCHSGMFWQRAQSLQRAEVFVTCVVSRADPCSWISPSSHKSEVNGNVPRVTTYLHFKKKCWLTIQRSNRNVRRQL
jgi:hypothetical protein